MQTFKMNTNISEWVPDGKKKKCSEIFPLNFTRCRYRKGYYERKNKGWRKRGS